MEPRQPEEIVWETRKWQFNRPSGSWVIDQSMQNIVLINNQESLSLLNCRYCSSLKTYIAQDGMNAQKNGSEEMHFGTIGISSLVLV